MKQPKKELDKWQVVWIFQRDYMRMSLGWYVVQFGIFKFTSLPPESARISKKNYKGFWPHFLIWLPIAKD